MGRDRGISVAGKDTCVEINCCFGGRVFSSWDWHTCMILEGLHILNIRKKNSN